METSKAITDNWGKGLTAGQKKKVEKKVLLKCTLPALEAEIAAFGKVIAVLNLSECVTDVLAKDIARLLGQVSVIREAVEKL